MLIIRWYMLTGIKPQPIARGRATEAEWEKAARGTDGRTYPWGNEWDVNKANASGSADGFDGTAPISSFDDGKSHYGAYAMAGNVSE